MSKTQFVTEIPTAPEEVTLAQAIGLIPKIAPFSSDQSHRDRLRIHDPVIRVFALDALISRSVSLGDEALTVAMHVARRSSYVRQLLVPALTAAFRFDLVERLMAMEAQVAPNVAQLPHRLMKAEYENSYEEQVSLHEAIYLQTGDIRHINSAARVSRERLSWQQALRYNVRMIFVQNEKTLEAALLNLMQLFERESARKEFMLFAPVINSLDEHKMVRSYIIAMKYFWDEEYQKCVDFLHKSNALDAVKEQSPILSNIAAKCYEKLDDYQSAALWYQWQNKAQVDEKFKAQAFIDGLNQRAELPNPVPIPDTHDNYFIMTGFPRSGTTLLENALNAHPQVATCEETSSMIGSFQTAFSASIDQDPERKKLLLRLAFHQQLYYKSIDRYIRKPDAKVVIDKTPIISANIKYMEKIFPNKKYIFSIRHPYDVVLSNIKQTYSQNSAMAAFNDIHDACVLYDKVMSDWFEVFPGETDRVCYIKYDDLVNDFKQQMTRALDFLGVGWTDEVMNFVEHSAKRPVRTPSYANVRKGLTIGVQSSWQNFDFMFDERCRNLLDPWVRRFGYTEE